MGENAKMGITEAAPKYFRMIPSLQKYQAFRIFIVGRRATSATLKMHPVQQSSEKSPSLGKGGTNFESADEHLPRVRANRLSTIHTPK